MSIDLAWKQRVVQEDRKLLAQVIEARRKLAESPAPSSNRRGSDVGAASSVVCMANQKIGSDVVARRRGVAAPVGSSVRGNRGSDAPSCVSSIAPSVRSSTSTQLSHHGASTVQGSAAVSQLTVFSTRLEKLEQRLVDEHRERMRVVDELAQIKQLLLQQQSAGKK